MNNALLYLGGILITALAILFAVPRFVDWNSYRGVFEEEASRVFVELNLLIEQRG